MKGSLIIVGFFAMGVLAGLFHIVPSETANSGISFYALCALMFCVGLSVGNNPQTSAADCMAVGAGFGYYSLSSIFITEYKGAELGTVALLSNIIREMITLLCAPLLVRWFGNLAPISAGGATTMDTTLPIIARYAGQEFAVISIFHGFVIDFSVPFLVTFFCSV